MVNEVLVWRSLHQMLKQMHQQQMFRVLICVTSSDTTYMSGLNRECILLLWYSDVYRTILLGIICLPRCRACIWYDHYTCAVFTILRAQFSCQRNASGGTDAGTMPFLSGAALFFASTGAQWLQLATVCAQTPSKIT